MSLQDFREAARLSNEQRELSLKVRDHGMKW